MSTETLTRFNHRRSGARLELPHETADGALLQPWARARFVRCERVLPFEFDQRLILGDSYWLSAGPLPAEGTYWRHQTCL
jgi:hypothetical protein